MQTAYLGLGSNLGDRLAHLRGAVKGLQGHDDVRVVAVSPVYETEAHTMSPSESQPDFLNAVVQIEVDGGGEHLLQIAHALEREAGRRRAEQEQWAPRSLDVDLLAVNDVVRQTERLTLPHPRLSERRFVLRPWADLAPAFVVPFPFEETVEALLQDCPDSTPIRSVGNPLSTEVD
ncbi:2-amino-4-hydroxy-6-hydroxymethyldihydropteridine diphosphokinase [Salinibacter sp. 10B]|uniref:2-amino-4-hydroxy-6- hydroxymethyldihydropteridine diphosphokinase n=1 Tax=Salinibacter sp. 10B TaxID=1923971 RepID=UPI000CF3EC64|nr:2-amino-4-hydroxy-6-hydroxymethyldihydropteridine diphosphokinase [Salinibacter sp. 10B]PQJ33850.1 2-amino-4-hydroxy-6-hydroxymethyldihydropteridine diphosphokinase [Salinibacter sp. 10B]